MSQTIEAISKSRSNLLLASALSYGLWQMPQLDVFSHYSAYVRTVLSGVIAIGALLWAVSMLLIFIVQRRMRRVSAETQAVLEDELVKANRTNALKYGYIILFGMTGLFFAICQFAEVSGQDVARVLVVTGVCVPLVVFAISER